ncbi:MAG TPA: endonuclease/exonuclease/phosphatase family protein [Terriglobales bacterium]|nr:endonuclease/exonuclease/phosphatase family protein [Terriglobales bacterium]
MHEVICGGFTTDQIPWSREYVRVITWNIERGLQFSGILDFLREIQADLILLQEVDLNAQRSQRRDVANDLARRLRLNYVFAKEFHELAQGSRTSPAYQGLATLSPWPLTHARVLRFQDQSQFWKPRWYIPNLQIFQRRLGGRIALTCDVSINGLRLVTYNLHLESRGKNILRLAQLNETLVHARQNSGSWVVLGGDFNLESKNSKAASAIHAAGFRDATHISDLPTTVARRFRRAKSIDRIYVSGAARSEGRVHNCVQASDHTPVSAVLHF